MERITLLSASLNKMFYTPADSSEVENDSIMVHKTERLSDFSSQSIVCAMDRFVKAVNNMNETIMVPSRLLDMTVEDKPLRKVPSMLQESASPHNLYNTLNCVKNELIRGLSSEEDDNENQSSVSSPIIYDTPWFVSSPTPTTAIISQTSSTSDFESEDDWDVSMGSEGTESIDTATNVMETLRNHLVRLQLYLDNLTNTATFITDCYKNEHVTVDQC